MAQRVTFYIDGFNFYYGLRRHKALRSAREVETCKYRAINRFGRLIKNSSRRPARNEK